MLAFSFVLQLAINQNPGVRVSRLCWLYFQGRQRWNGPKELPGPMLSSKQHGGKRMAHSPQPHVPTSSIHPAAHTTNLKPASWYLKAFLRQGSTHTGEVEAAHYKKPALQTQITLSFCRHWFLSSTVHMIISTLLGLLA